MAEELSLGNMNTKLLKNPHPFVKEMFQDNQMDFAPGGKGRKNKHKQYVGPHKVSYG